MKAVLAALPHADTFGYSMPPPGLLRLGGELRRRGHAVLLEDLAFRLAAGELPGDDGLAAASAARLLDGPPLEEGDLLGLSVMGATVPVALAVARRVRARRPGVRIVVGGPGTTGVDTELLERFDVLDAVVRGEAEDTLPELLDAWGAGRDATGIPGVTWRGADGGVHREADRAPRADLTDVAPYAWDLLPPIATYKALPQAAAEEEGLVPLDSGRGCPYDSSFCTIGRFWSRRSRTLPVDRLVEEVAALAEVPGAKSAYLCHDVFGADRAHALAFCEAMVARGVDVPWECRARVDHLDAELLAAMGRAGCYRVLLGIESGDAAVRNLHGKRCDPDLDVLGVVENCAANGIVPILSLILGLPGEDEAALERTLDLARDAAVRAGVNLSLHLPNPQPGCALGESHAARSRPVEGIAPDMALGAGTTAEERELIAAHPDLFSTWSLLPMPEDNLRELAALNATLPPLLMRLPRTFALVGRRLGLGTLGLWRRWRADGRDFEELAASLDEPLIDDVLAWERALEEAPVLAEGAEEGTLLHPRHDLARVPSTLREGDAFPAVPPATHPFLVRRTPTSVRTLRVLTPISPPAPATPTP